MKNLKQQISKLEEALESSDTTYSNLNLQTKLSKLSYSKTTVTQSEKTNTL